MSADTINATIQLPIWTIHGVNWQIDIPISEYNAQFSPEMQADEAATIAISVLKGKCKDQTLTIKLDSGEETPFLGTTLIAHVKDTDPNKGFLPLTHMILANDGYYKEAVEMWQVFQKQMQGLYGDYLKEEASEKQRATVADQLKNFDKLKTEVNKKPKEKAKKKQSKKSK